MKISISTNAIFIGLLGFFVLTIQSSLVHSVEVTFDLSYYDYEETDDSGNFFMSDESDIAFVSLGLRDWETRPTGSPWNFFHTLEITRGWVNYDGSGTMDKDYYKFRGEVFAGYRLGDITPIVGLGHRWLYDDSGGSTSSSGALAYDRQSQYLYLPLGAIYNPSEFDKWRIKGQFNVFLDGQQTSYLSDASAGYNDVENDQSYGWGIDFNVDYDLFDNATVYGFSRYWDIDRSSIDPIIYTGLLAGYGQEPDNTTTEIGVGLSYKY
jgi:hypothetical protein